MISGLVEVLVNYAKVTSPIRMAIHALIMCWVVTWVGVVYLAVTNFTTMMDIFEELQSSSNLNVEQVMVVNEKMNDLIKEQRVVLGVDRLYVSRFHNGRTDLNRVHFFYFSRVAEADGAGVSNEMVQSQNLPLNVFPNMLTTLSEGKCYYVGEVQNDVENFQFLTGMGIRSMVICPIANASGKLIGVIGAEAVRASINKEKATELEIAMRPLASVLGSLMSIR